MCICMHIDNSIVFQFQRQQGKQSLALDSAPGPVLAVADKSVWVQIRAAPW